MHALSLTQVPNCVCYKPTHIDHDLLEHMVP